MSKKIREDELRHIMREFTSKNLYGDMAMFFMTQDIEFQDMMSNEVFTNSRFYIDVFKYMASYLIDKYNTGRFHKTIWGFIPKLYLKEYTKFDIYPCGNFVVGSFILSLFKYFTKINDITPILDLIDALLASRDVDRYVITDMVIDNSFLHNDRIFYHLMSHDMVTIDHLIKMIEIRYKKDKSPDNVLKVIDDFSLNLDTMIYILDRLTDYFQIYIEEDHVYNKKRVTVKPIAKGVTGRVHELIRLAIAEHIKKTAEIDLHVFLNDTIDAYDISNDFKRMNIYSRVRDDILKRHPDKALENMLYDGTADSDFELDDNERFLICEDVLTWSYLREDRYMSLFDAFIRVYNINRYRFLQVYQEQSVKQELLNKLDRFGEIVLLALSTNIMLMINF